MLEKSELLLYSLLSDFLYVESCSFKRLSPCESTSDPLGALGGCRSLLIAMSRAFKFMLLIVMYVLGGRRA